MCVRGLVATSILAFALSCAAGAATPASSPKGGRAALSAELGRLQQRIAAERARNDQLHGQVAEMEKQEAERQRQLQQSDREIAELQKKIAALQPAHPASSGP
jgi:septal ring factor EnvC (AmiA/AmiB activator)